MVSTTDHARIEFPHVNHSHRRGAHGKFGDERHRSVGVRVAIRAALTFAWVSSATSAFARIRGCPVGSRSSEKPSIRKVATAHGHLCERDGGNRGGDGHDRGYAADRAVAQVVHLHRFPKTSNTEYLMDIGSISAALGGLKTAFELTKAAVAARDESKIAEAKQALNDRIIDVQNAALQLQERQSAARDEIDELKDQIRDLKASMKTLESDATERANYRLAAIFPGKWAYESVIDPHHYACQQCFDGPSHRKVLLQSYWENHWECPVCKNRIYPEETV